MLFNTLQFAVFFGIVLLLYRELPARRRNGLLLGASLVFYALWIPAYLLLLVSAITVNYLLVRRIRSSARPMLPLIGSVAFTVGLLVYYKYAAMLADTLAPLLSPSIAISPEAREIFLPLGISFYSFQIIALSVDVYRGSVRELPSFGRYALFVSFFPQLIAGPILRGNDFLPQLERGGQRSGERNRRGLWLIASGLVKKVILADFLLAPFVNEVFDQPQLARAPFHLVATYAFAFQIYFDFSGYSDMARGLACLLGFELPLNFMEPYLSKNPSEFWQRWHITLSTWLRDYIFVPLGGASRGARWAIPAFGTLLVGGLWHGAAWTFALWGAYHGLLLILHRGCAPLLRKITPRGTTGRSLWSVLSVVVTFHLMCVGLVIFRAASFEDARTMLGSMLWGAWMDGWPAMAMALVLLCMLLHGLERILRLHLPAIQRLAATRWWGALAEGLAMGAIVALVIAVSGSGAEFIYFQF
ncbi:MAG: MBOAT family protein [Deltaproteobacteria bacterium]|nr:MBOAT family protein [Deltaproteobacteria bacterium]